MTRPRTPRPQTDDWRIAGGWHLRGVVPSTLVRRMVVESGRHDLPWHSIFNATVGGRFDPARTMVYGLKDPRNDDHHGVVRLPALMRWGARMVRAVQSAVDNAAAAAGEPAPPRLRLADAGYIGTDSRVPQHWHRDVPAGWEGAAYSVFAPVNCVCPRADRGAFRWRPLDAPGRIQPMPAERPGDAFVLDSRVIHRGGARPRTCAPSQRIVAFAAVVQEGVQAPNYGRTVLV